MGPSESINRALNTFFNGFGIPGYLEDNIPPSATLPYLTYQPTIPGGWNESGTFHARLWYQIGRASCRERVYVLV